MQSRRRILIALAVTLCLFSTMAGQESSQNDQATNAVALGEPAPDFSIEGDNDIPLTLSDYRANKSAADEGQNVVVVFVRAHW